MDIQEWLNERSLIIASVRQHLLHMQQRMKHQADKNRTERTFVVGTEVFLRLQPYIQSSVVKRASHKLSFKFFGPYRILERVGQVAYRLDLPASSRVHPVFHVSQLKQCIGPAQHVSPLLPNPDAVFQIPVCVLQRRVRQLGVRTIPQVLVQWSGSTEQQATWEDLESLRHQFPFAPAWGQAGSQEEGIVSDPTPPGSDMDKATSESKQGGRPTRKKRAPARLSEGNWVT